MMRRDIFLASLPRLSSIGFKILLDIFASSDRLLKVVDVPYQFRPRQLGESKLDAMVLWEFLLLLLDKAIGRYIPIRFISFALVGGSGVIIHVCVLMLLFKLFGTSFIAAQTAATLTAITTNFLLNNALTYRDRRLKGVKLFFGWITFNLVCTIGAIANVGIANWMLPAIRCGSSTVSPEARSESSGITQFPRSSPGLGNSVEISEEIRGSAPATPTKWPV